MQAVLYSMFVLLCSRVARFVRKRFVLGLNLTVGDELYRLNQKHLRIHVGSLRRLHKKQ